MFAALHSIGFVSVILAFAANVAVGFYWYSPSGFGSTWMKLAGLTREKLEKNNAALASALILNFITTAAIAIVFALIDVRGVFESIAIAMLLWLGFIVTNHLKFALFEGRSIKLMGIYCGQSLVSFVLMGIILGAFR